MDVVIVICLVMMLISGVICAMAHSMLKSAMALASMSAFLAIIMFLQGNTWAAIFELSVCSGLVTVVFVSAISLTSTNRHEPEVVEQHRRKVAGLPLLLIFAGVALIALVSLSGLSIQVEPDASAQVETFRNVFWHLRQADILGQIIILLAGAFAVVILFKEVGDKEE